MQQVQHRTGIDPVLELGLEGSVANRLGHLHNRGGLPPHHRCDRGPAPGAADADLKRRVDTVVCVSNVPHAGMQSPSLVLGYPTATAYATPECRVQLIPSKKPPKKKRERVRLRVTGARTHARTLRSTARQPARFFPVHCALWMLVCTHLHCIGPITLLPAQLAASLGLVLRDVDVAVRGRKLGQDRLNVGEVAGHQERIVGGPPNPLGVCSGGVGHGWMSHARCLRRNGKTQRGD